MICSVFRLENQIDLSLIKILSTIRILFLCKWKFPHPYNSLVYCLEIFDFLLMKDKIKPKPWVIFAVKWDEQVERTWNNFYLSLSKTTKLENSHDCLTINILPHHHILMQLQKQKIKSWQRCYSLKFHKHTIRRRPSSWRFFVSFFIDVVQMLRARRLEMVPELVRALSQSWKKYNVIF